MDKPFNCWKCGACCKSVCFYLPLSHLDRGDGTCMHLQEDMTCAIYETRPDHCNTRTMYNKVWKALYSWNEYVEKSEEACHLLDKMMNT